MLVLPEHSHCEACGDPCAESDDFCGPECADAYFAERKRTRKKDLMFWIVVGLAVSGLVFFWLLPQ